MSRTHYANMWNAQWRAIFFPLSSLSVSVTSPVVLLSASAPVLLENMDTQNLPVASCVNDTAQKTWSAGSCSCLQSCGFALLPIPYSCVIVQCGCHRYLFPYQVVWSKLQRDWIQSFLREFTKLDGINSCCDNNICHRQFHVGNRVPHIGLFWSRLPLRFSQRLLTPKSSTIYNQTYMRKVWNTNAVKHSARFMLC